MSDDVDETGDAEALLRSKMISHYEILRLLNPIRESIGQVVGALVQIVPRVIEEAEDEEAKEAIFGGYERLGPVFDAITDFDRSIMRLCKGLDIDDVSQDETIEDDESDE